MIVQTMKFSRHRSYTTYSEENGQLVPSIEPIENNAKYVRSVEEIKKLQPVDPPKKLKDGQPPQIADPKK